MNLLVYVHLRNIYRSTGVGRVSREITEHLAARPDIQLQVLADRGDHAAVVQKVGEPWTGFRYNFLQHETSRQQALWYLLNRPPAETYWPDAEIVYCTAESYVPVRRAKLVVTSHDMQLFDPGAHALTRNLLQQRLKWWLLFRRLQKRATMFQTISGYSAERMAHYFPQTRSRIKVIPNGVSQAFFKPPTQAGEQILKQLDLSSKPYVLVPGGLHHRKNADLVLNAWPILHAQCPDLQLVVGGHNSPEYLARARALAPSLVLAGYLEEEQIVALYANAQVVWFPSRYEGFGMPVVEAMACGTPVITSNTTALPEVAGGAAAALLDPDKPRDHVDALAALLDDPASRAQAATRGRLRAAQFTWARTEELLVDAFRSIL